MSKFWSTIATLLKHQYQKLADPEVYFNLSEEVAARLRRHQIHAFTSTMAGNVFVNLGIGALFLYVFYPYATPILLIAWYVGLTFIIALWVRYLRKHRYATQDTPTPRAAILEANYIAIAHALWYVLIAEYLYFHQPALPTASAMTLTIFMVGIVAAGTVTSGTMFVLGAAWTIIITLGAVIGMVFGSVDFGTGLALAAGLFTVAMLIALSGLSNLYYERMAAEVRVEQQTEWVRLLLREFASETADGLWETDTEQRLTQASTGMQRLLDRSDADILGSTLSEVLRTHTEQSTNFHPHQQTIDNLEYCLQHHESFQRILLRLNINSRLVWVNIFGKAKYNNLGRKIGWRGVLTDVTEQMEYESRLSEQARTDPLTGLLNRRGILPVLQEISQGLLPQRVALIIIDLDNFKETNDSMGHDFGDAVLCSFAELMTKNILASDIIARIGGDEFAIFLRNMDDKKAIEARIKILYNAISQPLLIDNQRVFIRMSVGVAIYQQDYSAEEFFRHADIALYAAKDLGKSTHCFFDNTLRLRMEKRAGMLSHLSESQRRKEFFLVYQPWQALHSDIAQPHGFEVLLRWRSRDMGVVSPDQFIELTEESKLICDIGRWVLQTACKQARQWQEPWKISINLSAKQFIYTDVVADVKRILMDTQFPAERLELEFTESIFIDNNEQAQQTMAALHSMGVSLALDDFGTGYSALGYLRDFHFDKLKIDRRFIERLNNDEHSADYHIALSIIRLAKALDTSTVAEGVSTAIELITVRKLGCDYYQGYFFSEPLNFQDTLSWQGFSLLPTDAVK